MRRMTRFGAAVVLALLLAAALLASLAPGPAAAQSTKCYMERGGLRWICSDGGTMVFEAGSTLDIDPGATVSIGPDLVAAVVTMTLQGLTVTGDAAVTGTLTAGEDLVVGGDATVTGTLTAGEDLIATDDIDAGGNIEAVDHMATQGELYLVSGAAVAVTDGATITPTEALVELTATGTVTASLAAAGDGQLLVLVNSSNSTINLIDTGTTYLAGDAALGQRDTITLIGLGVSWYEVSRSNN